MFKDSNFKFRVNVSNDYYVKKSDASACLSKDGAKAIGKVKMAFREYDVTVDQFLEGATKGYAFCNLFDYNPNKEYWFETGDGHRYHTTPLYKGVTNKDCMRLEFKSDRFFCGAQTVFVDIDKTRFLSIPEYLQCLTYPPTCVYMSYSDGQEKRGVTSRRFRMVYVFDHVLGKDDLNVVSRFITDSIVRDTGEPMEDDCGTRVSQYFNGVYGNNECYASYCIYSRFDFPGSLPDVIVQAPASPSQQTEQPDVEFDERMLHDMGTLDYGRFMHYYSLKYSYIYRAEHAEWIDGLYQETGDDYLQLWWPRERITDGNHRRRTLFKFACLRRLIMPGIDADTLLFNMYVDRQRFIDNSDFIVTLDTLTRKTKRAMNLTSAMTGQNRFRKMPLCLVYPRPHCIDIAVTGTSRQIRGRGRRMFRSVKPRNRTKLTRRPRSCCIMILTCQRPRIVRKCYSMAWMYQLGRYVTGVRNTLCHPHPPRQRPHHPRAASST